MSRFGPVYVYSIYRRNLKDQFFEQVKNSQHHSVNTLSNIKFFLIYLHSKLRPLIDRNDDTREGGIGLIPIGSFQFINQYSIKFYWDIFIKDLRKRFCMYQDGLVHLIAQDVITRRIMAFEDFVSNDDSLRKLLQDDYSEVSIHTDSTMFGDSFDHKKSQANINCYKNWEDSHLFGNLKPVSSEHLLTELKVKIDDE